MKNVFFFLLENYCIFFCIYQKGTQNALIWRLPGNALGLKYNKIFSVRNVRRGTAALEQKGNPKLMGNKTGSKELKKMSRRDLLELLIEQGEQMEYLETRLNALETALRNRRITAEKAGSIAEAALRLNGVFEAAESAARQYIENIECLKQEQEAIIAEREAASKEQASRLIVDARNESIKIVEKAKRESEQYWNTAQERVKGLMEARDNVLGAKIAEGRNGRSADEAKRIGRSSIKGRAKKGKA